MNSTTLKNNCKASGKTTSMQEFCEDFIEKPHRHIGDLRTPGRLIEGNFRRKPLLVKIEQITEIQQAMREVLCHSITQDTQVSTELAFKCLPEKKTKQTQAF